MTIESAIETERRISVAFFPVGDVPNLDDLSGTTSDKDVSITRNIGTGDLIIVEDIKATKDLSIVKDDANTLIEIAPNDGLLGVGIKDASTLSEEDGSGRIGRKFDPSDLLTKEGEIFRL